MEESDPPRPSAWPFPPIDKKVPKASIWSFGYYARNNVQDPGAPELYSERAITVFSFMLAPLFSAVLFSMNLHRLGRRNYVLPSLLFGVLWFVLALVVLPEEPKASARVLLNGAGGFVFLYLLWPRWIGKDLKYRPRQVGVPVTVAVGIMLLFLWASSTQ